MPSGAITAPASLKRGMIGRVCVHLADAIRGDYCPGLIEAVQELVMPFAACRTIRGDYCPGLIEATKTHHVA